MNNVGLFLDRDGVINEDFGYVGAIENFKFINGVFLVLKGFMSLNYKIFIITNQSGISRGFYSEDDFNKVTDFMMDKFINEGILITKVYHCSSSDNSCFYRKPNPGMILQAKDEFDIDLKNSILIGDKISDILAGLRAGVGENFLINPKNDLLEIYNKILKRIGK